MQRRTNKFFSLVRKPNKFPLFFKEGLGVVNFQVVNHSFLFLAKEGCNSIADQCLEWRL